MPGPLGTSCGLMETTMAQTTEQLHQALNLLQENTAPLWPDFTPARTPFLVFDGQDSWLLHADPPSPDGWQRRAARKLCHQPP